MSQKANSPELSIVATVYNSAGIIELLVTQITTAVATLGVSYEIILVDDGSSDDSAYMLEQQSGLDQRIKSIVLSRNFGQQVAMSAGIHHAMGLFVLIMDGDLQNPPDAIVDLYWKMQEGYDIVYTTSLNRNNAMDSTTSYLFWKFFKTFINSDVIANQTMMRIMTAYVGQHYREYPEKIRTVAAITHDIGMRQATIPIETRKRIHGSSNYNTLKRLDLSVDVMIDFSNNPLKALFYFGVIILIITSIAICYYLYSYMNSFIMPGFTSLILLIMLFGSLSMISIGILGRYMANIYTEVKCRPLYLIRKTFNVERNSEF